MIESIKFSNYRVLRDAVLPLSPFTVVVGPNGSGKSTIMHALRSVRSPFMPGGRRYDFQEVATVGSDRLIERKVLVEIRWAELRSYPTTTAVWVPNERMQVSHGVPGDLPIGVARQNEFIRGVRIYALDEHAITAPVLLNPEMSLREDGGNLAGVVDRLRDQSPEAFEALNDEVGNLLPEFDRILFETPAEGQRAFMLRMRKEQHALRAKDLSQGTILALAILTLAHLPDPPSMVCIEEPDRGIHPRLYRDIRDALYRLSYPESFGLDRKPVQVLITTHSPYLLDLHREHPEEIVIAQKTEDGATFQRLSDREDLPELLEEASLGDIWYSGILGGVPTWR